MCIIMYFSYGNVKENTGEIQHLATPVFIIVLT